jgi:hypothetical protein
LRACAMPLSLPNTLSMEWQDRNPLSNKADSPEEWDGQFSCGDM